MSFAPSSEGVSVPPGVDGTSPSPACKGDPVREPGLSSIPGSCWQSELTWGLLVPQEVFMDVSDKLLYNLKSRQRPQISSCKVNEMLSFLQENISVQMSLNLTVNEEIKHPF